MGILESVLPTLLKSMGPEIQQNLEALGKTVQNFDARFRKIEQRLDMLEQASETNCALLKRVLDILETAERVDIKPPALPAPIDGIEKAA